MNFCYAIPFVLALIFYFLPQKLREPKALTLISWVALGLVMLIPCKGTFTEVVRALAKVARDVESSSFLIAFFKIFSHNLLILILCALFGRAYLGFMVGLTGIVSRELANGFSLKVLVGAHTLLELYAYSLATKRSKRTLVEAVAYLALAAAFEVIAIRF